MQTIESFCRKLSGFFDIAEESAERFLKMCTSVRVFVPGEAIARMEQPYDGVYLVSNGWALRQKVLSSGARQIVNVAMPADILCINSLVFDESDFDIVARTEVTAFHLKAEPLREALGRDPDLAAAIFWVSAHEESLLAERIVSLGRRSARERAAHVLCEIVRRISMLDEEDTELLGIPLTQEDFSDILGISIVHMNKTLRVLEAEGVISFRKGVLTIGNRKKLEEIAGFDSGYLHFTEVRERSERRQRSVLIAE